MDEHTFLDYGPDCGDKFIFYQQMKRRWQKLH